MKNVLLLFVLGFALFWVGCEKEQLLDGHNLVPSEATVPQKPDVRNGQQSELQCCTLEDELIVNVTEAGLEVTVSFMPPVSGNAVTPVKWMTYSVNGVVVHDPGVEEVETCSEVLLTDTYVYDWEILGECPDLIEVNARVGNFGFNGFKDCPSTAIGGVTYMHENDYIGWTRDPKTAGVACGPTYSGPQ